MCVYIYIYTMEARYVEAGSMSIFWTQNRAFEATSLARVRWVPALLYVGPKSKLFVEVFGPVCRPRFQTPSQLHDRVP